ncbi:MAG: ATP-binding protein, partial [Cyanobacteria bacterium J06641_5]
AEAGFGWKLGEIVAAQTIYVPANEVFARSRQYLGLVIGVFAGVSAAVVLAIRFLLQQKVVFPVRRLTSFTGLVGTGQQNSLDIQPIDTQGLAQLTRRFDEIGELARAFKAMALEIRGREADLTKKVQARTAQLAKSTRAAERARQQAEHANHSKSQFLANMSHELRTPLNAILGFTQIIDRAKTLPPEHQKHLNTILRSGEHLLALINDVLDMAKIEAGRVSLNEATFNLHSLLDSLEAMFQLRCQEKGIQLYFRRSPDVPKYVESDESKLRQILINLLGNAVKFTHAGSITLSVDSSLTSPEIIKDRESLDDTNKIELSFEVTDTGIGIAQNELEAIFEPFVQTRSSQFLGKGTGLGLPISRQFARIMGGKMWASSELGQGSSFRWYIAAKLVRSTPAERRNNAYDRAIGLAPGQAPKRILVVDDRFENRELLIDFLSPIGFEVRTAADGQAGVDCWQAWKPHLIWMDIRMPGMDGLKATRQIRILEKRHPDSSHPQTVIIAFNPSMPGMRISIQMR